jgi:hypothetical protein
MILGNEQKSRTPSGYKVAPMSYAKLEELANDLRPLLPVVQSSNGWRVDAWRTLEQTLSKAGFQYRSEEKQALVECAAFTIPEEHLVVLREDVYDGLQEENVFSRSTVIHELSHIVLKHALTLRRGAIGQHQFYEDSEWQAKALTAAIMMPIQACAAAPSEFDLAHMCGTSVQAATYRLQRLTEKGLIPVKEQIFGLFNQGGIQMANLTKKKP